MATDTTDKTAQIMDLAKEHQHANGSSMFCYNDALTWYYRDNDAKAQFWAVRSLLHSVGLFHPHYLQALALSKPDANDLVD